MGGLTKNRDFSMPWALPILTQRGCYPIMGIRRVRIQLQGAAGILFALPPNLDLFLTGEPIPIIKVSLRQEAKKTSSVSPSPSILPCRSFKVRSIDAWFSPAKVKYTSPPAWASAACAKKSTSRKRPPLLPLPSAFPFPPLMYGFP